MKKTVHYITFLSLLAMNACYSPENELEVGADYTISSLSDLEKFTASDNIHQLTISGEEIITLAALPVRTAQTIVIENTGLETLELPQLQSITTSLIIRNNENLRAIAGLEKFKFMNGTIVIDNNPRLENLSGLLHLKVCKGAIVITNNSSLGKDQPYGDNDDYGLFPLKYLSDHAILEGTVTLANNHPGSATELALVGQLNLGTVLDFTLTSKADAEAFSPPNDTVNNLTIRGLDINTQVLRSLAAKIKVVKGTVTIENTSIESTEGFFDVVECLGGIVLRNNLSNGKLLNANGFKNYTHIGGDLIIENCPGLVHWVRPNCFTQVESITGSVRVINSQMAAHAFASLVEVGGDFEIRDCNVADFWNMSKNSLEIIGGDFIYTGNNKVNSLSGFGKLTTIGGDVTIGGNGSASEEIPNKGDTGWCLVKSWVSNDVISSEAALFLTRSDGKTAVDLSSIDCNE